ncbi:hypothetical protein B0J14DRAFT_253951 [Halenospora varia]|nr:hypothetical protein B0J14DRAFT_253951 [Halenospora varia]
MLEIIFEFFFELILLVITPQILVLVAAYTLLSRVHDIIVAISETKQQTIKRQQRRPKTNDFHKASQYIHEVEAKLCWGVKDWVLSGENGGSLEKCHDQMQCRFVNQEWQGEDAEIRLGGEAGKAGEAYGLGQLDASTYSNHLRSNRDTKQKRIRPLQKGS